MLEHHAGEVGGLDALPARDPGGLEDLLGQLIGEDQPVTRRGPRLEFQALFQSLDRVDAVVDARAVADRAVGRDGPGRGRPDHDRGVPAPNRELHPDRRAVVVGVLDLGLGQGGALDRAPHHRLGAAIELARHHELVELGGDRRFAVEVHRRVAALPVGEHAEALEALHLLADPVASVGAALGAELGRRDVVLAAALGLVVLLDLPLDRQAVTVPAGDEVDVVAEREAAADDEVLQQLVERVADVDGAVGVGRAVMEHVQRRAGGLPGLAHQPVQVLLGPVAEDLGLLLRQAAPHGERGVGKEDGVAVIARGSGVVGHGGLSRKGRRRCGVTSRRARPFPAASRRADNSRALPNRSHGRGV